MAEKPKVGVVGPGRWGRLIVRDLVALGAEVWAVARSAEGAANARAMGAAQVVAALEELPVLDGYVVATPERTHLEQIEQLLPRDRPIFVEKPLDVDLDRARALPRSARRRVFVMHKWRYHPGIEALAQIVRSSELGAPRGLSLHRVGREVPQRDVSPIWILAPHDLSIALHVLGEIPQPVWAADHPLDLPGRGLLALLRTAGGVDVSLDISASTPLHRRDVVLACSGGGAQLDDPMADHITIARHGQELERRPISTELPLLRELRVFLDHLAGGPAPMTALEDELDIMRAIVGLIRRSGARTQVQSRQAAPAPATLPVSEREASNLRRQAHALVAEGRFDAASEVLDRAQSTDPEVLASLAKDRAAIGDDLQAAELYQAALAMEDRARWRERLARLHLRLGDHAAAHAGLKLLPDVATEPKLQRLLDWAALRLQADREAGVTAADRMALQQALADLRRGRSDRAEARLRELVRRCPQLAGAWVALRGALEVQGRNDDAAELGRVWSATGACPAEVIRAGMDRRLSARGLVFDPRADLPLRTKEQALTRAADPAGLHGAEDSYLVVDPGGEEVAFHPFIAVEGEPTPPRITFPAPEAALLSLANAMLVGPGVVVTQAGEVMGEALLPDRLAKFALTLDGDRARFSPAVFADGADPVTWFDRPALLMTGPTSSAFGDWISNFAPRLLLAEAAGLDAAVLVGRDARPQYLEMLEALGVPRERLVVHDPEGVSVFPRLYVPTWPALERHRPMAGRARVFERASVDSAGGRPLLFLSRGNFPKRALVNEPEVRELFASRGFQVIRPEELAFRDMLALFSRPAVVAGPFGSAWRNVVFCREKPLGLLLHPRDEESFERGTAIFLAEAGVRFASVVGSPVPGHPQSEPRVDPWEVDIGRVERALDTVMAMLEPA